MIYFRSKGIGLIPWSFADVVYGYVWCKAFQKFHGQGVDAAEVA